MFIKKAKKFNCIATKAEFDKHRNIQADDYLQCPDWAKPVRDENGNYEQGPDALYPLFDPFLQKRFYEEGTVALGALVQANTLLFKRGKDNCPANYIYTTDPYLMAHPNELEAMANQLYALKGAQGCRPSLQLLADLMDDEVERIFAYKLPRDFTDHREVFFTTVFVDRSHLPEKVLRGSFLPLLVLKGNQPDAVILPHWYWEEEERSVEPQNELEKKEQYNLEIQDHLYEIYRDFQRRNSMDEWTAFLQRPELSDKEVFDEISKQLFSYHLDCNNIRHEIVTYLEAFFRYTERIDYYGEIFTYSGMEYYQQVLLAKKEFPPIDEFESLSLDADYDGFIDKFQEIYYSTEFDSPKAYLEALEELKKFQIYHPYMALLESEYCAFCQNAEQAMDVLRQMKPCYHRHLALGLLLIELEFFAEGEESLRYAWELHEGGVDNAFVEAMFIALFCQGKHKAALAFSDEMEAIGYGPVLEEYKRDVLSSFYEYAGEKAKHESLEADEVSLIFEYLKTEKEYDKIMALGQRQRMGDGLEPRDWLAFIEACILSNCPEEAEKNIVLALESKPQFSERDLIQIKVLKAQILFLQRETKDAYEIMDELYRQSVLDVKQMEIYGQMCRITGRYQIAEKIYSKLRFDMPQNPTYTVELAKVFLGLEQNERAYRFCENGLEQFVDQEDLAYILVQAAIDCGDYDRAVSALERVQSLLPTRKQRFLKGQLEEMEDNCKKAKNIYGGLLTKEGFDQFEPELAENIYFRYFLMQIEEEIGVNDLFQKIERAVPHLSSASKLYQLYGEVQETTMEDTIAAKKYYNLALEENPYNNVALVKLIQLCGSTHRYEEAWNYACQYVLNTDSVDAYLQRAHIALDAGRLADFTADVEEYINRGGLEGEIWDFAASHAVKTGDYEKALECYEKVLKHGIPGEAPCYEEIAVCYCKLGQYQKAIDLLQEAVVQEDYADCYALLMEIQLYIGDFADAKVSLENFRNAKGLSKSDDEYVYYYGMQLLAAGKFKQLMLTCASGDDAEVTELFAKAWLLNGNYKMAVGAYTMLLEDDDYNLDYMSYAALAFALHGDADEAKSMAARARGRFKSIYGEPEEVDNPALLCQYGLLQILCGKPDRASFALEKAMTLPTCQGEICQYCHEAHFGMGLLHGLCGEKKAAKESFDKAIEMSPYNATYKALRAKLAK